jgi:hypothetical protein
MYSNYQQVIQKQLELSVEDWDFKQNIKYKEILEHVSIDQGHKYLEIIKNDFYLFYLLYLDKLKHICYLNDKYGKPNKYEIESFMKCSPTNLRYILHSILILKDIQKYKLNNIDIIEIGGGYGGLCFFIHNIAPLYKIKINSYTIFDLLEASLLQKRYLNALNIKNIKYCQLDNFNNLQNESFLISNYAFSEISEELQCKYIEKIINPYTTFGFLAWNYYNGVYDFVPENSIIEKEKEYPHTNIHYTNYYVRYYPTHYKNAKSIAYIELNNLISKFKKNEPFLFARYNDGEYISICGWDFITNTPLENNKGNIDGHKYPEKLNECLRYAISCDENIKLSKQEKYIFQSKLSYYKDKHKHEILNTIKFKVDTTENDFSNMVYEFPDLWIEFINVINNNFKVVFVGPEYCKNISFLNINNLIVVPNRNCFSQVVNIQNLIDIEIVNAKDNIVFLFAAGLTTNYIIEKFKYKTIDKHFMIDVGSGFDNFLSKEVFPEINRRIYNPQFVNKHYPDSWWINSRKY